MRRLNSSRKTLTLSWPQAKARHVRRFLTGINHPLQSYANAKKRNSPLDGFSNRFPQPALAQGRSCRKVSHAWQNNLFGTCHYVRIRSHHRARAHPVQSFLDGSEIAGTIIHNGNSHLLKLAVVLKLAVITVPSCWAAVAPSAGRASRPPAALE